MTSTMAGSSSIIMILAIKSQRGEYFRIEKKKAEMRKIIATKGPANRRRTPKLG
jgi:hypothetical protein